MKTYLLTGGIGSGKSSVLSLLEQRGICTFDLDRIGHDALDDPDVSSQVVHEFGPEVLDGDGRINRGALAKVAFASEAALNRLNAITHPAITVRLRDLLERCDAQSCPIAVVEASAWKGPESLPASVIEMFDGVIAVSASEHVQLKRAVERGMDEASVQDRIRLQPSNEHYVSWADYVIENDSDLDSLARAVDALLEKLACDA